MIMGRGPGAPGVTSGVTFTRGRVTAGNPGDGAVDLGEIRRSDEIIGVLGARAARPEQFLEDPAVTLLSALAADVNAGDAIPGDLPAPAPAAHRRPASGCQVPRQVPRRAPAPAISTWARAAAVNAVIAGVAGSTSVVAAGMLARLARGPASGPRRSARGRGVPFRSQRPR